MPRVSIFPPVTLDEALLIAKTIWEHNAGKPMRRLTIFHSLNRSPDSSTSRSLVTASSTYGLTQGGYRAETLQLTERGQAIAESDNLPAKIDAVLGVDVFRAFFENYRNSSVPSTAAANDFLVRQGVPQQSARSCLEIILKNGESIGLIREVSGSKRVVSVDHALEGDQRNDAVPFGPNRSVKSFPEERPEANSLAESLDHRSNKNTQGPSLHIDVQIHIAADAKPEQIDQIFASMAKHLYDKN